jgi:glycosyltransferase involved in cell wall biosynthesis
MKISIIIPAYNEEDNINQIYAEIENVLKDSNYFYEIIFVNDGSTDHTERRILELIEHDDNVKLISFSKNFGHMSALIAGYNHCNGDAAITMDCDLQHPPELIKDLIKKWKEGFEIVNTLRIDKNQKNIFKKYTSYYYYKLFELISDVPLEKGSADYRLIDKKVLKEINELKEHELFLRGIFYWLGFKKTSISYIANNRYSGKTKYSLKKMIHFALNGITSFSTVPLKIVATLGFWVSCLAFVYLGYTLYSYLFFQDVISGWTSLMISILFLGGIQLISIGVLGEYIGKIFIESKSRPRYIVRLKKGI